MPLIVGRYSRYEIGGVRGGFTLVKRGAFELHDVQLFRGQRVTGKVSKRGSGTLRVNGRRVRISDFTVV
jgi:hypothetical protein